ncbi:hypothetical protein [Actinoplanes sp. NPDC023714]
MNQHHLLYAEAHVAATVLSELRPPHWRRPTGRTRLTELGLRPLTLG